MKVTTTIEYYEHGGALVNSDKVEFMPFIGQIIENQVINAQQKLGKKILLGMILLLKP